MLDAVLSRCSLDSGASQGLKMSETDTVREESSLYEEGEREASRSELNEPLY